MRDEESPARVPFLDRLGPPFTSTFRPQEALSHAGARRDGAVGRRRAPAGGVRSPATSIDNAQANELTHGARRCSTAATVHPNSGAPGYDGVQAASTPDPFYYRPDVDAPRHPGVLATAQRPFRAAGLRAPWYPARRQPRRAGPGRGGGPRRRSTPWPPGTRS